MKRMEKGGGLIYRGCSYPWKQRENRQIVTPTSASLGSFKSRHGGRESDGEGSFLPRGEMDPRLNLTVSSHTICDVREKRI